MYLRSPKPRHRRQGISVTCSVFGGKYSKEKNCSPRFNLSLILSMILLPWTTVLLMGTGRGRTAGNSEGGDETSPELEVFGRNAEAEKLKGKLRYPTDICEI
eukprot:1356770-Amorphochlora_amoeboformis.AAC.1